MLELAHAMMRERTSIRPHELEELFFELIAADLPTVNQRAVAYALRGRPEFSDEKLRKLLADRWIEGQRTASDDDNRIADEACRRFGFDERSIRKASFARTAQGFRAVREFFRTRSLAYLQIVTGRTTDGTVATTESSVVTCNARPKQSAPNASTSHQWR